MNVGHGLPRLLAGVEDHAVAGLADAVGRRDLARLADHLGEQPAVGGGERRDVRVMILRDDEHMNRGLRVDVAKREYAVGFADHGRGDLTGDDGAEQAVSHTKILEGRTRRRAMLGPTGLGRRTRAGGLGPADSGRRIHAGGLGAGRFTPAASGPGGWAICPHLIFRSYGRYCWG